MRRRLLYRRMSLVIKLLVLEVSLALVMLFIIDWAIKRQVARNVHTEGQRAEHVIREYLHGRHSQIKTGLISMVDSPEIKAVLSTAGIDRNSLEYSIKELNTILQTDIVLYTDPEGRLLMRSGDEPFQAGRDLAGISLVEQALNGTSAEGFFTLDGRCYLGCSYPVLVQGTQKGAILAGVTVGSQVAASLKAMLALDVVFVQDGSIIASSLDDNAAHVLEASLHQRRSELRSKNREGDRRRTDTDREDASDDWNVTISDDKEIVQQISLTTEPLANHADLSLLVLTPYDQVFGFYYDMRSLLVILGATTLAMGGIGSWYAVRSVGQRVGKIVNVLEAVAGGDLTQRLTEDSDDEFGRMASALNIAVEASERALGQLTSTNQDLSREISERKRAEQEVTKLHQELVTAARQAGMAEIASGVLHNVGNVLNSINVSANVVIEQLHKSKSAYLQQVVKALEAHDDDVAAFLRDDAKGRQLPSFFKLLNSELREEQALMLRELKSLNSGLDHVKTIIATQQSYTGISGITEVADLATLINDAVKLNIGSMERHNIVVRREDVALPEVLIDKHKVLQILVNLINNGRDALTATTGRKRVLTICTTLDEQQCRLRIEIRDNGVGIPKENITRIFSHGFTTKRNGHGFGLHCSANVANEMEGALHVHSDGVDQGAVFTLELPFVPARVAVPV